MTQTEKLTWRPFAPEDFERTAELLGRTWLPEFDEPAQHAASQIELAHYLAQTTWSLLAEREGEILGVVLLSERDREAAGGAGWAELETRLTRAAEKDEALAEAVRVEMDGVREEAELEREYAAEEPAGADAAVKLLIVSPDAKGLGLGGRLFSAALDHLPEELAGNFRGKNLMIIYPDQYGEAANVMTYAAPQMHEERSAYTALREWLGRKMKARGRQDA